MNDLCRAFDIKIIAELLNPPRTKLFTTFRRVCQQASSEDHLIIYFSGHGIGYRGRDFLVPVDATLDDIDVIEEVLVPIDLNGALQQSRTGSVTFIMDACREGIELDTKGTDFTKWSFQKIEGKTSFVSLVFSCAYGQHSRVINSEMGSLFTTSLHEAIIERDYAEGNIDNIVAAAQNKLEINARMFLKPSQTITLISSRPIGFALPPLFPNGKRLLGNSEEFVTGWHRSCDFLWPDYTKVYDAWSAGHKGDGIMVIQLSELVYDAHVELRSARIRRTNYRDGSGFELISEKTSAINHDLFDFAEKWRQLERRISGLGGRHATAVAGALCGTNVGICPGAELLNISLFEEGSQSGHLSDLIGGLSQALNISLASPMRHIVLLVTIGLVERSDILETVIGSIARLDNVIVVAPAGNTPKDGIMFPADYSDVLSVGAVDRSLKIEAFSDFLGLSRKEPDVYGLSGGLLPSSTSAFEYAPERGTSYAAAYVAGIAALVWAANPAMTSKALRLSLICNTMRLQSESAAAGLAVAEWLGVAA